MNSQQGSLTFSVSKTFDVNSLSVLSCDVFFHATLNYTVIAGRPVRSVLSQLRSMNAEYIIDMTSTSMEM